MCVWHRPVTAPVSPPTSVSMTLQVSPNDSFVHVPLCLKSVSSSLYISTNQIIYVLPYNSPLSSRSQLSVTGPKSGTAERQGPTASGPHPRRTQGTPARFDQRAPQKQDLRSKTQAYNLHSRAGGPLQRWSARAGLAVIDYIYYIYGSHSRRAELFATPRPIWLSTTSIQPHPHPPRPDD